MKRIILLWTLAVALLAASGCQPAGQDWDVSVPITVTVVDGIPVKSTLERPEAEVRNLSVALYADGRLCHEYYFETLSGITLDHLRPSCLYDVYALANQGRTSFPAAEADVFDLSVGWAGVSNAPVWPMAFTGTLNSVPGASLLLPLTRLVARIDLTVDAGSLSVYRFTAQKVELKCGAGDCRPFVGSSVPLSGSVQPDVASASDVSMLNAGGATSYYLFESCFGDLLPDNHDAWNKVPSQLSSGVAPPYLEITGLLTVNDNSGTDRTVTYRFYLGQNATRNFDILRNTVNTVTLVLTDANVDRGSWKVEAGPYNERASIAFTDSQVTLPWLSTGSTGVRVTPGNLKFRVYEKEGSMSSAGLSFYVDGKTVRISSTQAGAATGTLYAGTIDGRLECSCRVSTVEPPVTLTRIVLKCSAYCNSLGQYVTDEGRSFDCSADLSYSDGTEVHDVTDFEGFEWVIADDDIVSPVASYPSSLFAYEPGETLGYIRKDGVSSNSLCFRVRSPHLSVRAVPSTIASGDESILMATYGSGSANMSTEWEILEGDEYGELEDRLYTTFVSNGTNTSEVTVVIAGTYRGETATCAITILAPQGGSTGDKITHAVTVDPSRASIDYNGTQSFAAYYHTYRNGVLKETTEVTGLSSWSVDDTDVAKISSQGSARGCNTEQVEHTVTVTAVYAGHSGTATLIVGAAPDNPVPPGPDPGPDPPGPVLTGITLSLDKDKIWYGESVQASVTAWYDNGSYEDVTGSITDWPVLEGCIRQGTRYRHNADGLRADAWRSLTVRYRSFGATAEFMLGRQYTARVEAVFPATLSWDSERQEKPAFRLVYNDGTAVDGHPGDLDYFTVDGGAPMSGGSEIGARDYAVGTHLLTVYVRAENRTGSQELMSGSMTFSVIP